MINVGSLAYLLHIFRRNSCFSLSDFNCGGFGRGVLFSANFSSSFFLAWRRGAPEENC